MKTIYILTAGEYSDYHIVATFSTKELAEEAMKLICEYSQIKEYELDSLTIPEHPPGHTAWYVRIDTKTGILAYTNKVDVLNMNFSPSAKFFATCSKYVVECWARDKEHAEKIALDKYYQWKYEVSQLDT